MEARWQSRDGKDTKTFWLPHLDLDVSRAFTAPAPQANSIPDFSGTLTLRGQLDLFQMLQPAVQPGSGIDWERPPETVEITLESYRPFDGRLGGQDASSAGVGGQKHRARVTVRAPGRVWQPFELRVATEAAPLQFTAWWSTADDPRPRAFPLRRFLVPFAQPESDSPTAPAERQIPEIAGGNWLHGRRLFFSEKLACAKCHAVRDEGSRVGPDLSNLVHRDYSIVRKDIQFPNAAINPDHVASLIELTDGEAITAIVQRETDGVLTATDATGQPREISRAKVKSVKPSALSLMPEGLWEAMDDAEQRDLMTFLLTVPQHGSARIDK